MRKMQSWDEFDKELLKDPEVAAEYERLRPYYEVASQLIGARIKLGLTQKQLAEKLGTKQSAIARLESGDANISLEHLEKIAHSLGLKLDIRLKA